MKKYDKILTKDFLINKYVNNKDSAEKISKEVGCSRNTVYNFLYKFDLARSYKEGVESRSGKNCKIKIGKTTAKVYLGGKNGLGKFTTIDVDTVGKVKGRDWSLEGRGYAVCYKDGRKFMHYVILPRKKGLQIDHINGDKLDNRLQNLRYCTPQENSRNKKLRSDCKLGYKGVSYRKDRKSNYRAFIFVDGKRIYLGTHTTPKDAAIAYDNGAKKYFGEFASLNFPEEKQK